MKEKAEKKARQVARPIPAWHSVQRETHTYYYRIWQTQHYTLCSPQQPKVTRLAYSAPFFFGRAAWKNPQVICEVFDFHSLVNTKTKYFLGELFELRYHHDIFSGGLSVSLSCALSFPSFRFSSSSCLKLPGFLFFSL